MKPHPKFALLAQATSPTAELPYAEEPEETVSAALSPTLLAMLSYVNIPDNIRAVLDTMPPSMVETIALSFSNRPQLPDVMWDAKTRTVQTDEHRFHMPALFAGFEPGEATSEAFLRYILAIAEAKDQPECVIRYCAVCGLVPCNIGHFGWIKVIAQ